MSVRNQYFLTDLRTLNSISTKASGPIKDPRHNLKDLQHVPIYIFEIHEKSYKFKNESIFWLEINIIFCKNDGFEDPQPISTKASGPIKDPRHNLKDLQHVPIFIFEIHKKWHKFKNESIYIG